MKLEVIVLAVSDVDRAREFYENLGWRVDIDIAHDDFHAVHPRRTTHQPQSSLARESRQPSLAHRTTWSSPWMTSTPLAPT